MDLAERRTTAGATKNPEPEWSRRLTLLLGVIVAGLAVALCYFASSVCITIVVSTFLAILLEPVVHQLERVRIGRTLAAGFTVLAAVLLLGVLGWAMLTRVNKFANELPRYSYRLRGAISAISGKLERIKESAETLKPAAASPTVPKVKIEQSSPWPSFLIRGLGSVSGALVVCGIIPFLVFFMLVRKDQMQIRFASLFGGSTDVEAFVRAAKRMVRGYILGSLVVVSMGMGLTWAVLTALHVKSAIVLALLSAVCNLIPFLGLLLAEAIPLAAALLQFVTLGPFVMIALSVLIIHLTVVNLLVPKIIGSRVNIGPVAATIGVLFWGWLWGAVGLVLAVPLTAFLKLVADFHPSLFQLSNMLSEAPRPPAGAITVPGEEPAAPVSPFARGRIRS